MRCYLVQGGGRMRYAGTQADARVTRDDIVEQTGCKKKDVSIEEAEIPVAKAELIAFVNELCAKLDKDLEE